MRIKFWYFLTAGVLALDLIMKAITDGVIDPGLGIPGFFSVYSIHNTGASFSILAGKMWFFITLAVVFIIGMLLFDFLYKKPLNTNGWYKVGFTLVLGGILGNLIDRIAFGYVRDFIHLDFWPSFAIFNIADIALCVGVGCLMVWIIFFAFEKDESEKKEKRE